MSSKKDTEGVRNFSKSAPACECEINDVKHFLLSARVNIYQVFRLRFSSLAFIILLLLRKSPVQNQREKLYECIFKSNGYRALRLRAHL